MQIEKCKRKSSQSELSVRPRDTTSCTESGEGTHTIDLQIGGVYTQTRCTNWPHHLVDIVNNAEKCDIRVIEKCTYIISCS